MVLFVVVNSITDQFTGGLTMVTNPNLEDNLLGDFRLADHHARRMEIFGRQNGSLASGQNDVA